MKRARTQIATTFKQGVMIGALRRYLFHPDRLTACAFAFILAYAVIAGFWLSDGYESVDFSAFWAASWLVLNHTTIAVYDTAKIAQAHTVLFLEDGYVFRWLYPPTFLFFVLPLGLMPYAVSYSIWILSTLGGYAWALSNFAKTRWMVLALLAFPGTYVNLLTGQNGLLLASFFTAAAWNLERRPVVAGVFIGLLSVKPQFGILWPVALLCGGHWRALITAAITTVVLALAAAIAFGGELWVGFANQIATIQQELDSGQMSWIKIPTFYGGARLLGLGLGLAYTMHFVLAATVIAAVGLLWSRRSPMPLRIAALAVATLIVMPRLLVYDFALLALPLTLMLREGLSTEWKPWERPLLILCWLTPLLGLVIAIMAKIQIAPFLLSALFLIIVRRSLSIPTTSFRQNTR